MHRSSVGFRRRALAVGLCLIGVSACDEEKPNSPAPAASLSSGPLPPELANAVLARVGTRSITLGDYRAALERMDQFERLRYQGMERRTRLLEEMVNLELLAEEARRRGLDRKPETRQHLRQMLRDEMLEEARRSVPKPEDVPDGQVRAYYEEHKTEFAEPERRRVAHIALGTRADADKVLRLALEASPDEWGRLVEQHSLDEAENTSENTALELAGDLGIVGPVSHPRGGNPRVPEPLRQAVFDIEAVGGVHPKWIEADGKFHVLRMTGKTDARQRTFVDAERSVRVTLVQGLIREAERRFEAGLRQRFPVTVDEKALAEVKLPTFEEPVPSAPPGKGAQAPPASHVPTPSPSR